jgi:hypothetical protein
MTEMVKSGPMSGVEKRSDGPLGESASERIRSDAEPQGPDGTALHLDSTEASGCGWLSEP